MPLKGLQKQLRNGVGKQLRDGVSKQLGDGVGKQLRDGVGKQLRDGVGKQLKDGVGKQLKDGADVYKKMRDKASNSVTCNNIFKALLVRGIMTAHGLVTVWRAVEVETNGLLWLLALILLPILGETIYRVWKRKGLESDRFLPAFLFYIFLTIPAIWILELHKLRKPTESDTVKTSKTNLFVFNEELFIFILEQGLFLIIIFGRWLVPKPTMSEENVSQILFAFFGKVSDMIVFFNQFDEPDIKDDTVLTYVLLSVWTLSVIQFTIDFNVSKTTEEATDTSTNEEPVNENGEGGNRGIEIICSTPDEAAKETITDKSVADIEGVQINADTSKINSEGNSISEGAETPRIPIISRIFSHLKKRKSSSQEEEGSSTEDSHSDVKKGRFLKLKALGNKITAKGKDSKHLKMMKNPKKLLTLEQLSTVLTICTQDVPYFIIRIYIVVNKSLKSYSILFFLAKNALVVVLFIFGLLSPQLLKLRNWAINAILTRTNGRMGFLPEGILDKVGGFDNPTLDLKDEKGEAHV